MRLLCVYSYPGSTHLYLWLLGNISIDISTRVRCVTVYCAWAHLRRYQINIYNV